MIISAISGNDTQPYSDEDVDPPDPEVKQFTFHKQGRTRRPAFDLL